MAMLPPLPRGMTVNDLAQEEKETRKRLDKAYQAKHTALAVDSQGRVHEQVCFPPLNGTKSGEEMGLVMFHWYDGKPVLQKFFRDQGYTTFIDECEASGQPELVERYEALVLARLRGTRITGKPDAFLPKTVLAKRKAKAAPGPKLTTDAFNEKLDRLLGQKGKSISDIADQVAAEAAAGDDEEGEPEAPKLELEAPKPKSKARARG